METESKEKKEEGKPPEDEREGCLMCGACEVSGKVCVLPASRGKN